MGCSASKLAEPAEEAEEREFDVSATGAPSASATGLQSSERAEEIVSQPAPHPLGASAPVGRAASPPEARSQRASELDATQSPHVKSRSQENSSYPQRQAVEDGEVPWEVPFPGYAPTEWTHDTVFANSHELNTGDGWADPPRVSRAELAGRKTYAFDGQTEAVMGRLRRRRRLP